MNILLNSVLSVTYNQLIDFANKNNFWQVFDTAFGTQYNRSLAEILRLQWEAGDFSQLPQIEILDSSILGSANGAYASSKNKIYLSNTFVAGASLAAISGVLLEEIGHFVDAKINQTDSAGDEGAIFAALVQGQNLDVETLRILKAEDDHSIITLNNQQIDIEQANTTVSLPGVYNYNGSVTWADYNGDGKQDLLLTGYTGPGSSYIYISKLYKNTGNGFTEDTTVSLPDVYNGSVAWADYNGDSKQDFLLTGSTGSGSISKLYKNIGNGFTEDTTVSLPGVSDGSVAWADYNGDGKQDLLLTGTTYISKLYKNTGNGFTEDITVSLPGVSYGSVAWADYNGDGKQDFLLTGYSYNTGSGSSYISKLYKNTGNGFTEDTTVSLPGVSYGSVAWVDYNGDGKQDFLLTGVTSSGYISKLYKNTGNGFTEDTTVSLPGVQNRSVAWADYNGDGKQDFLLTGYTGSGYISKLYKNTGNGFTEDTTVSLPRVYNGVWADYNGDGKQDLLLTGSTSSGYISKLYKNTGNGFTEDTTVSLPGVSGSVAWADYNGDGKQEFLLTGITDISKLYKNTGNGFEEDINANKSDTNQAPTNITLNNSTIAENQPINTKIGNFTTIDPNTGDTFTYSLVSGTGDTNNNSFIIVGNNELQTKAVFDYETKNSYSIRIKTTDQGGLSFEKQLTIGVTDVNETPTNQAPTNISLNNSTIAENQAINTVVGNFTTTDPDEGNTFTYTLVSGTGDTDNNVFTITNNELKTNSGFDYETKNSYSIRVKTTDQGGLSFEKQLTIGVTDVNEVPVITSPTTANFAENGTGIVYTAIATDVDAGTPLYSLSGTDASLFNISNGNVNFKNAPNFELPSDSGANNVYDLNVIASDGSLTATQAVAITVTNVNEVPSNLTLSNSTIAENQAINTVVGNFTTIDPDEGDTFTYTLVSGTGDTDNNVFTITNNELKTNSGFDYETKNSYSIRVKTTDQGGLSFEKQLTIGVTDVNETVANLSISPSNVTQTEGNSGTKAFTFTVTRSGDTSGSSSANWAVTGSGTNQADVTDFGGTLPTGTVGFAAGETTKTIIVDVLGDTTVEPDEGFTVTLSNPTNATITTATAVGTITNDDNNNPGSIQGFKWNDINGNGVREDLIQGDSPNIVFVIDVSGSTRSPFQGIPVGDVNNDGTPNTILDAEIAGFIALNNSLVSKGLGSTAKVSIVSFESNAYQLDMEPNISGVQLTTNPETDSNKNGTKDVEETLRSLRDGGGTNFEIALQKAASTLTSIGTTTGNGNVIFISDGENDPQFIYTDEVSALQNAGVKLSAFGVGTGARIDNLKLINSNASIFTSTDQLLGVFNGLGSGTRSFKEPGLSGVSIYLDLNNNEVLDIGEPNQVTALDDPSTTNDEAGQYSFTNLQPGTYIVREVVTSSFSQTFPNSPNYHTAVVASGQTVNNINFGNTTPSPITLKIEPQSVTEDGTNNLIYTFTRSGNLINALTVNYSVAGTAIFNTDYNQTGAASFTATGGTVTFATGLSTATVMIDPIADTTVEGDETVELTLAPGAGYIIDTTSAFKATITNDDSTLTPITDYAPNVNISTGLVFSTNGGGNLSLDTNRLSASNEVTSVQNGTKSNFNHLFGIYEVVDAEGGINTEKGVLKPGDSDYALYALTTARVKDFIVQAGSSDTPSTATQLGSGVSLQGNKFYAPFVIANCGTYFPNLQQGVEDFVAAENGDVNRFANAPKYVRDLVATEAGNEFNNAPRFVQEPVAYFSFGSANPDKSPHLRSYGNGVYGFEDLPATATQYSNNDFNDAVFALS